MFGGLEPNATVVIESFLWYGKRSNNTVRVGETLVQGGQVMYASGGPRRWVVGERTDWETLGDVLGRQHAPYMKVNLRPKIVIHCTGCGKQCNTKRGETLTRTGVWCGKCYSPDKHGPPSTTTNYVDKRALRHRNRRRKAAPRRAKRA